MEKISDTITSIFHIVIKDKRPVVCSSGDGTIVWSDSFGLGWRFGISYNPHEWFAKIHMYLDHNQSYTEEDQASATVSLRDTHNKGAESLQERVTTITDFGHGQPILLGSWSPTDLASHPYVSLTLVSKTRLPQLVTDPLSSTALAVRQSMLTGDFVDTKFYVFSAKHPGSTAGKPRGVYANSNSIGLTLPKSSTRAKRTSGSVPTFLVNMTGDNHINEDAVLHEYEYENDSDLDDNDKADSNDVDQPNVTPAKVPTKSSSKSHIPNIMQDEYTAEPPAYSVSVCRMILVKGVAYRTWLSYIYFRYTGQVSFLPLKSTQSSSQRPPIDPTQITCCSPKSMYRLAVRLGDQRMKELAFRAITNSLSKDNVVEEAFSWFTAQYPSISEYEVELMSRLRKSPQVSSALKLQLKAVSLGEKPWAQGVLIAIMDKFNPSDSPA